MYKVESTWSDANRHQTCFCINTKCWGIIRRIESSGATRTNAIAQKCSDHYNTRSYHHALLSAWLASSRIIYLRKVCTKELVEREKN